MQERRSYAPYLLILGLTLMLMAVGQFGQGNIAWADGTLYQTVPTRTPTPDSGSDNDSSSSPSSEIIGQVIDASTGSPGAGVTVRLNDIEVRTDTQGKYSLSGLSAGEFVLTLVLEGGAVMVGEPVVVSVDGRTNVTADLQYYSNPADAQTAPPPAEAADNATSTSDTTSADDQAQADNTSTNSQPQASNTSADSQQESNDTSTDSQSQASTETQQDQQSRANNATPQRLPVSGGAGFGNWIMLGAGFITFLIGLKLQRAR